MCMTGARSTCHNYTFITSIESATEIQLNLFAETGMGLCKVVGIMTPSTSDLGGVGSR